MRLKIIGLGRRRKDYSRRVLADAQALIFQTVSAFSWIRRDDTTLRKRQRRFERDKGTRFYEIHFLRTSMFEWCLEWNDKLKRRSIQDVGDLMKASSLRQTEKCKGFKMEGEKVAISYNTYSNVQKPARVSYTPIKAKGRSPKHSQIWTTTHIQPRWPNVYPTESRFRWGHNSYQRKRLSARRPSSSEKWLATVVPQTRSRIEATMECQSMHRTSKYIDCN